MSVAEMKEAVKQKVDLLDEAKLREVDAFIEKINHLPTEEWDIADIADKIMKERTELLKALAK